MISSTNTTTSSNNSPLKTANYSKRMLYLLIAVLVLLGGLSVWAINKAQKQNDAQLNEITEKADLTITPASTEITLGKSTTFSVDLSGTPGAGTDTTISYDPQYVTPSNITNGTMYSDLFTQEIGEKTIRVVTLAQAGEESQIQAGTVFTFTVTGKKTGKTTLSIVKDSSKIGLKGSNILNNVTSTIVVVK